MTSLVAIDRQKVATLALDCRRLPLARVVACAGQFDFDDIGAKVAQEHRTRR